MGGAVASEHDACALVSVARKDARPTREVLDLVLYGMACLAHRSGAVDGEGDGAGVLTDIPRALWADLLARAGEDAAAVHGGRFAGGDIFPRQGELAELPPNLAGHRLRRLLAPPGTARAGGPRPQVRTALRRKRRVT